MIDWPSILRDWITPVVAVAGLALSVWNRTDKWIEDRKKEKESLPWARIELGAEKAESKTHGVRPVIVIFENSTRNRWRAIHARITEPATALIKNRNEQGSWARDFDLDWIVTSIADDGDGKSQGMLDMMFERQVATGKAGPSREVALTITVQEVSSKRRRHKFEARTARRF